VSHFVADIKLLSTSEGGRKGPLIRGEWRTVLGINGDHWSARLTFEGEPAPGDAFRAQVALLHPDQALRFFQVGSEFMVSDGGTKATGLVVVG
jgi:hypothetical protein